MVPPTDSNDLSGQPQPTFAPGSLLAERYRIRRFVASGGNGEVYEAQDLELDHTVALKTLQRERAVNPNSVARFKREITLARQVTHPNICRIYDFGAHLHEGEEIYFLTMEFLQGKNLYEHIWSRGTLSQEEALPMIRQIAEGLSAAHRAGVIHRDLKSSNVVLIESPLEADGMRVVITDFGLARSEDNSNRNLTAHGQLVGTPAYMAPEQVLGEPITMATDIYALGVMLYEMMTGRPPFDAESAFALAVRRIARPPSSPRLMRPDLDISWEEAILCCLSRKPEERFATPDQLIAALEGEAVDTPRKVRWRRWRRLAAAVAIPALVGLGLWQMWPETEGVAVKSAAAARRSIAMLGVHDLSGRPDSQWLSKALPELLAAEVAAGGSLRLIPGEDVNRAQVELGVKTGVPTVQVLRRLGQILGCDLAVLGSYVLVGEGEGEEIRLDLQIRNVDSGETLSVIRERASERDVLDLVEAAGRSLRAALDAGELTPSQEQAVRASRPADPEAVRLYAEGLELLRDGKGRQAIDRLEQSTAIDPDQAMAHSALARAWGMLGYRGRAHEAAQLASELTSGLPENQRLWVEAGFHEATGEWRSAISAYQSLWQQYPDDFEYGLRLARAQTRGRKAEDALTTIETLRQNPALQRDPRIDLAAAEAARSLSRYQQQRAMAARAADKAAKLGARLILARAREVQAGALRDLGQHALALEAYEEARQIHAAADHLGPVARILIAIAKVHRHQGRFDEARGLTEAALAVARDIGDQNSVQHGLNTLAIILRQQGKLSDALVMHELELAAYRETAETRSAQIAMTSIGVAQRRLGDLSAAKERFEQALELGTNNPRSIAINSNLLAEVLLRQGQLDAARRNIDQALEQNRETGSPRGRAYYLMTLGEIELARGRRAAARLHFEESLDIRRSVGERTNIAYSELALAELARFEQKFDEALQHAKASVEIFAQQKQMSKWAEALSVLALIEQETGQPESAVEAMKIAQELILNSENRGTDLTVQLHAAELAAQRQQPGRVREILVPVIKEAATLGFVELELQATLLLAEAEGGPSGQRRRNAALQRARELGFLSLLGDE